MRLINRFNLAFLSSQLSRRFVSRLSGIPRGDGKKVVVALSGGVDSSVSAYLLKKLGYDVIGLYMNNWDERSETGQCSGQKDEQDAEKVCMHLGIPFHRVDFVKEYWNKVFEDFISQFEKGLTPNPDVFCNREIKFQDFIRHALTLGADCIATGHYAQLDRSQSLTRPRLLRAADPKKDQSYFLSFVRPEAFERVLFPVGSLHKSDVRLLAEEAGLHTSSKKDSVGICFVGKRNFSQFLTEFLPKSCIKPGSFVSLEDGTVVGQHKGLPLYTIGQGARINGASQTWYVASKDLASNRIYVVGSTLHPALFFTEATLDLVSCLDPALLHCKQLDCLAQVRSRSGPVPCQVSKLSSSSYLVKFVEPQKAVVAGQALALYSGPVCLGGGIVTDVQSLFGQNEKL